MYEDYSLNGLKLPEEENQILPVLKRVSTLILISVFYEGFLCQEQFLLPNTCSIHVDSLLSLKKEKE